MITLSDYFESTKIFRVLNGRVQLPLIGCFLVRWIAWLLQQGSRKEQPLPS